ncbi:hypothetical protein B9Z19DRAFT_1101944 [Tuber borchii]|uniref:Uncharacterized protein n=1 Tax=Tuber borchii TaxID=42251 RepID=A0A2T6ZP71_TUBBO|nr:hypothetical protein B9Z19DRAFT_1101944 [Tuber borchii]
MAASSSSGIVERQYNYGGLIVRTFVHSAKSSPPPALGAEDSQSSPLNSSTPNNQVTSPVKRGRGRPRKNPKPNSVADDDDAVSDKSSQPASSSQQKPPKKKRKQLAGVTSGNSRVPAYVSLLTEEEMTAVRKRNRRGKQWIPGEKTVMNELARLGRSVPDLTETHQLQNGEDGVGDDEDPEAEFGLAEGIEPADDDVIDCDPFTGLDDMRLDSTDNAGMTGGVGSSSASDWMRANNEQTQFQQQTESNGESSFDYYMCPPNGASTLEPPSAALDKDSSFAEQLNSVVPELSEPILRPSDAVTTLSHPTPPPSSLSPQNPPPKRPSAPPPPAIPVDTAAALGAKLVELIAASQTAFIPTLVHCSFTLPLPEGEFTQKQYATDLVSAISDVDRYVYVTKNSTWNSTNSGSRGAIFVCNMSLESLKKRKSGTGEDQKKVSMARTRYPCEGCITIRFLAKKNVISVLYKHHAIHRSPHDKIEDSDTAPENNTTTNTIGSTKDALTPLEKPPAEEIVVPALAQIPSIAGPG